MRNLPLLRVLFSIILGLSASPAMAAEPTPIRGLFLGDQGHHRPSERFPQLAPVLAERGIELDYTEDLGVLTPDRLAPYDVLVVYANAERISPEQEQALLDFVAGGKGLVPLHCASFCFLNSDKYIALVGAQFQKHETGTFRTEIVAAEHPIMQGFGGFESWDETYVHHKHNEAGRTVLEVRDEKGKKEPWTWVRNEGKGRVFYTAWGHDHRTWRHPGFANLVERGIRWAAGRDPQEAGAYQTDRAFPIPEMTKPRADVAPFEYVNVGKKIPNYPPSDRWGVQEEPFSEMQKPLAPEESIKHLFVPEGFHAELFVSEPELGGKPIAMAWDERGRLWVAETYDYPNELQPAGEGRDRIRICEDTDGDNRADKFTVFAEQLSIPTAIAFSRGGAIVQNAQETLYLKDTDCDDVADERRVLLTGWAAGDTHGGVSNFQYGLDNWIWGMQGYNDSTPTTDDGKELAHFRQGFFRFTPDCQQLEFVRSTNNNTWGLGISEEGLIFGSTANRCPSVYMPIANRYYESVRGWSPSLVLNMISDTYLFKAATPKVRQVDQHGGYTAGAGHALYTARNYAPEYWNRTAFVTEGTGHLVGTFVLERDGTDFRSENSFNLVASDDEWTAPIMAEVGPDGNIWVIDWYNYIVQHNPTPQGFETGKGNAYESDLRDKKHGRIYRIVPDASAATAPAKLDGATPEEWVKALAHSNQFWRKHAQRLLVERGELDVLPALITLTQDQAVDPVGLNVGAIHALWTMHGLGALEGKHADATAATVAALKHPSPGVRMNAVQVLPKDAATLEALVAMRHDQDELVRLNVLLALAERPANDLAAATVFAMVTDSDNAADRWIPEATICAAAANAEPYLMLVAKEKLPSEAPLEVARIVAGHYARQGNFDSAGKLFAMLADAEPHVAEPIVAGLVEGWPADGKLAVDAKLEDSLEKIAAKVSPGTRGGLVKLASRLGSERLAKQAEELTAALLAEVLNEDAREARRIAAAREYIEFQSGSVDAVDRLLDEITPRTPPSLAAAWLQALELSAAEETASRIMDRLDSLPPDAKANAFNVLLGRPEWTRTLLRAAAARPDLIADLSLDRKQALLAHPNRRIREQAGRIMQAGGALPDADRQKVLEELLPIAQAHGDAVAGKAVFTKYCATCHTHSGEGKRIGPDLTGMAVHPKAELLGNIIDPSKSVEGNFRVYTVETEEGQVLTGLLASESRTAIELIDAEGKTQTLLREDIAALASSRKSLMPEGFEKQMTREEMTNLLEFLAARGKYLPLDLSKVARVSTAKGMFYSTEAESERLIFDDWNPKTFENVPFVLVDPRQGRAANAIMLFGPQGSLPPTMPRNVDLICNAPAKKIHFLSGVSGWGFPYGGEKTVSMIVRLHFADGTTEDHELRNGVHFADYVRRVDVPESTFAFDLNGRQIRYLAVEPSKQEIIERIELVKGEDATAPVVMAVTVEAP
jgi:putative membrane-bound dehydrogenase-like protein